MSQPASSLDAILAALPAVQAELRIEIAARVAAGEAISGFDQGEYADAGRRSLDHLRLMLEADCEDHLPDTAPIARRPTAA